MIRLALLSVTRHSGASFATALVALVGVALLAAMAAILGTGLSDATPEADRAFLVQFPVILGSWILGIVVFAVVSTIGVALGGRTEELRGLRLIGATPGQIQQMIAVETVVVSAAAALPGVLLGYLLGGGIVAMTQQIGVTTGDGGYSPGIVLPVLAGMIVVTAAGIGALVGSRAGASRSPVGDVAARATSRYQLPRRIAAIVCIGIGLASSATALGMEPGAVYATAATGPGCVLVAVGAALLAQEMLRAANRTIVLALGRLGGADILLATINLRIAPERIRPAITFLTLFVGVAAGTLSMQAIENAATASVGGIGQFMATINYLVVFLIAAFMTIALVNNLVASIRQRRGELSVMLSVGATIGQSTRMLLGESAIAVAMAVVVGGSGAVVAVVPFAILKTGTATTALQLLPLLSVVASAAAVTFLTTAIVGRHTARIAGSQEMLGAAA